MGGCCCCSSRRGAESSGTPVYYYCPQDLEEHDSLSSNLGASSAIPTGILVDTNLETSIPDTYHAPPAPLPYDVDLGPNRQSLPDRLENSGEKDSPSAGETISGCSLESLLASHDEKYTDSMGKTDGTSPKASELEPSKLNESLVSATYEEDACPICLEEYDLDNPRLVTKCDHHFHLACILEWMERSDTCPICDQEMIFDQNFDR